jgi:FAD/FMN-containing dehydrogenase
MTQTIGEEIEQFRAVLDGPVIAPGDEGFDAGRRVWNAEIDRRPRVIARCTSPEDVAAATAFAQAAGLEVSVRGAGTTPPARRCAKGASWST